MSDRTNMRRKKVGTTITNPSLVSSSTPTLANSNHSLISQVNTALPEPSVQALSNQQDTQSNNEQLPEEEAFKQEPLGHDISRISLRPQSKLSTGQSSDPSEPEANWVVDRIMRMPEPGNFADQIPETRFRGHDFSQPSSVSQSQGHDLRKISMLPVRAKLTVSQSGDPYEQEADWVANEVMRMQIPESNEAVAMRSLRDTIHRKCAVCEEEYLVQPKSMLQRSGDGNLQAENELESRLNSSQGGGSPLPDEVRSFMEPRFGADFSQVRVHTGSEAVQMNQDVNAQAFTRGSDIYYGGGKSPGNNDLTAHELTHVVQQTGAVQQKPGGTQAEPVPKSTEIDSQTANPENSQNVERIVNQIVNALQADPGDQSGRIKQLFARLNASTRQAVLTQLQARLTPEQQHSLQTILSKPSPTQTELPSEQMAPHEQSTLDDQHQRNVGSSQNTEQKPENQVPTDSSQTPSASGQERKPGSKTSDTPERQKAASDQASSSSPGKSGASVTAEQANSQQATISKSGSRQGSAQKDTSTSHQGEGQAATAKIGSASSKGNASLAQAGTQATSSEARSGSSSSVSQPSGQGVSRSSAVNQGRSPNQSATAAQPLQSPEVQVPSARSQNTQALLEQVATTANSARQRFTERITQGTEAIAASIQQQQAALTAAGEQQTGAIQALFANARAQVGEIIISAQAQLQTEATSHLANLEQGHTATLGQVETAFASGQERVQKLGNTYAERSLQTADESAQQVQTRIQGMAQESRSIGQEKAQVGGSTPEVAQAKAKVANEIASDTATKITSGVSDAMRDLQATGPETARGFREQGQEAARQVGAGQAEVVNQLNTANQQTSAGIQQAVTQGSQALGNLSSQLTEQLASLEQTIQNQLQTEIAQKNQEIAAAGQQAITTFQEQGQQAIAAGDEHLAQFNQQLAGMDIDPALAAQVTGEIVGQVNGAYDNLIATTDGAFQQADSALTQAGTEVMTAINGISTNAAGQIQTFLGQAQGQVTQQVSTISGQLGTTVSQANTASSGMVSQVTSSLDGQLGQIDSAFGQGLEQYRGALNEHVTSAEGQAREPRESLPGRVEQGQQKVEERAKRSWIENQWNDLVGMFSWELLAGLVVGLLVGVFIIVTFGTGAAVLIIAGAIAGAVGALAATVVGNYRGGKQGWALFDGALNNIIWGAFGGAVGAAALVFLGGVAVGMGLGAGATLALLTVGASVVAGIVTVIDNVAHDRPWDKNLVANMLLAGVLTWIGGKIAGHAGEKPPGTEPPGTEPPGTEPPGEEPPGCFVARTKVLTPKGEKNIESIVVGDEVWSLTPSLEEERTQFVEFTFIRSVTTVVDIQIGETTITCSPEHPFWVPQQGWLKAKELQVGSTLFSLRQGNVTVEHIQIRTGTFTVYNIEVNGLHNYCVSPLGILVHNKAMRWNLQDRAAALRGKVNELIEQASSLPDEAPGKADLLRQAQELEPEASRLSRLAEESGSPEALEPSRSAIENLEERIGNLENQLDIQGIPNEVPGLQAEADALLRRAKSEIPIEVPERWLIIQKIGQLQQDIADLRTLIDEGLADKSVADEYWRLRGDLADLERKVATRIPVTPAADLWQQRLDNAEWSPAGYKHMEARSEAQAREMTTPTDRKSNPASQYLPNVNNQALELEALRNGEVIKGDKTQPEGTVHVRYDAGRVIGYDGGEPVTTMRAEISGKTYHGHPRNF